MATQFKVEIGVPLPPKAPLRGGRKPKYPFGSMDIGDSFFVPANPAKVQRVQTTLSSATRHYKSRRFTTRRLDGGVRIWRIA